MHMTETEFITRYGAKLNPRQQAAVRAVDGPVLLLAVPGSGKTTALVTRLGYMLLCRDIRPEEILTMTYTVAATRDMQQRFSQVFGAELAQQMEFRTINGLSARIIRHYAQTCQRQAFTLITDERELGGLIAELCRRATGEFATDSTVQTARTWITYIKNMRLEEDEIAQLRPEGLPMQVIYHAYCRALRSRRWMDYDDQLVYALQILERRPQIAADFRRRYPHLCVDEAQDTSRVQHDIIRLLAQGGKSLFLVGDEDQSIYGFRAAYPEALLEFERRYPQGKVLYLEENYRSLAPIVTAADAFVQRNRNRRPKHMRPVRGAGPAVEGIPVANRAAQYRYLVQLAKQCREETAVLYRNNESALPVIDLLQREGIPYRCRQFDAGFFTHRIVRDVADIICFAYDPADSRLFLRIYYKFNAGISKKVAEAAVQLADGGEILPALLTLPELSQWTQNRCQYLIQHLEKLPGERGDAAIRRITENMGYGSYLEKLDIDKNKLAILAAIGAKEPGPAELLGRLEALAALVQDGGDADSCFVLSTIHASKGLEYDNVILLDVADGILPGTVIPHPVLAKPEELRAYEEERRLFYVAMTRAKNRLSLFQIADPALQSSFCREVLDKPSTPGKKALPQTAKRKYKISQQEKTIPKPEAFCVHQAVRHKRFGAGTISARQGDVVSVAFADGSLRRLSLSVALRQGHLQLDGETE